MDKKSRMLLLFLGTLFVASVALTFLKAFIFMDYTISLEVDCDPQIERCFVAEEDGQQPYYYKIVTRPAYSVPLCDAKDSECLIAFNCKSNETNCHVEYCNDTEGASCSKITEQSDVPSAQIIENI